MRERIEPVWQVQVLSQLKPYGGVGVQRANEKKENES